MDSFRVVNTTFSDLDFIYWLFEEAIKYQRKNNYPVWRGYDKDVLRNDVECKYQYKILVGNDIACIFSLFYADPILWRDREKGDSIYLHRVVVNPRYKGQKQLGNILNWLTIHAKQLNMKYIKIDTWADNPNIIEYYKSFGFEFVENFTTPDILELPSHHRNLQLALLELPLSE